MDVDFSLVVRGTSGPGGTPCLAPVVICEGESNSFTSAGTTVIWVGTVSVSSDDFRFFVGGVPADEFGLWFYGDAPSNQPVGNGTLCVGGTLYRYAPVQSDFLGTLSFSLDLSTPPDPMGQVLPGSTWYFQYWYRDPAAGGANFNFSDAVAITFCD